MTEIHEAGIKSVGLVKNERSTRSLKTLIWIYFWLLIFEGAVRKWLPPLSNAFFLVRDPIALLVWIQGARLRVVDRQYWIIFYIFAFLITLLGLVQVLVIPVQIPIFLFGLRSYVLHLPVIFIAAAILKFDDIVAIGKWTLIVSLPMTALMLFQYNSSPDSFWNLGASGGEQISAALGHIRPAGTFSFISGPTSFVPMVGAFFFFGIANNGLYPRWLIVSSGIGLLTVVPFSGSRTIAVEMAVLLLSTSAMLTVRSAWVVDATRITKIVFGFLGMFGLALILYQIPFVQDGINSFAARWTQGNETEGGAATAIQARGSGGFGHILHDASDASLLGVGIGVGSNFASSFQRGYVGFSIGEGAWEREINELGSLFGLLFVALRILCLLVLAMLSFKSLRRGRVLSWYLLAGGLSNLLSGLLDQPTSQGFLIFVTALMLADINREENEMTIS